MSKIANFALRGLELFFGILILGLAGHLVATQALGGAPSATNYEVFLGIWIIVIALLGIAGTFISALGGVVMAALDALSILFTFAGGVAYAAQLGVHSCSCNEPDSNCSYLVNNSIINGGKDTHNQIAQETNRVNRCREAQAATAFTWFAFACFLATCFLSVRSWRSGGIK